ncbi:MAG TPA: glycosyltransferase family 2 protein [Caulobacteraceae bacterium]|nr:glycosyltransferase family 2 protein [Caulobacteraceae bacterium]
MTRSPTVSVIIAAYNVEDVVGRAIESALSQTAPPLEIIVADDGSRDGTVETVRRLAEAHPEIRILSQEPNGGPSRSRNRGLEMARGDWVAVLDADDAWRSDRLRRLLEIAAATGADYVADNLTFFDLAAARETGPAFQADWEYLSLDVEMLLRSEFPSSAAKFPLGMMKPLVRRAFLEEKGLRYDERLRTQEDLLFTAEVMALGGRAVLTPEPLYIYSLPIGALSNRLSPHSHTYGYPSAPVAKAFEEFLERHGPELSPGARTWAEACQRKYSLYASAQEAKVLRHAGRPVAYLGYVGARPALAGMLIRSLLVRAGRRARALAVRLRLASPDKSAQLYRRRSTAAMS